MNYQCTTSQFLSTDDSDYTFNPWGQEGYDHGISQQPYSDMLTPASYLHHPQHFHIAAPTYEPPPPLSMLSEQHQHPTPLQPCSQPTDDDIYTAGSPITYTDENIKYIAEVCLSGLGLGAELSVWPHPSRPARCTTTGELETSYTTYDASPPPQEEDTRWSAGWYSPPQIQHIGVDDATAFGLDIDQTPNLPSNRRGFFYTQQHHIVDSEPWMAWMAGFDSSPPPIPPIHPKTVHPTHPPIAVAVADNTTHDRELSAPARHIARLYGPSRAHPYSHSITPPTITTPSDERDRPPRYGRNFEDNHARFRPNQGEAKTQNNSGFEEEEGTNRDLSSGQCPSEREIGCRPQIDIRSVGVTTQKEKPAVATMRGKRGPNKSKKAGEYTFCLNERPSTRKPRKGSKRTIELSTAASSSNQAIEEAARVESQASTSQRFFSHTKDTFAIQLISPDGLKGWKPVAVLPLDARRFAPNSDV